MRLANCRSCSQEQIKTVICDPINNRRLDKLEPDEQRGGQSGQAQHPQRQYGKALLSKRSSILNEPLLTILDCGGMRRATLRGLQNLQKRFKLAALHVLRN